MILALTFGQTVAAIALLLYFAPLIIAAAFFSVAVLWAVWFAWRCYVTYRALMFLEKQIERNSRRRSCAFDG